MQEETLIPVYHQWTKIPNGLFTKTQLLQERLVLPEGVQPVAYKKSTSPVRYFALYRKEDAVSLPPKREMQPKDYTTSFEKRYVSKRAAYLDASNAMFEMNRYAKWPTCTSKHQTLIYELKNRWIALLYREGFCTEAVKVTNTREQKMCWDCNETGVDEDGDFCWKCNGTGIYRPRVERVYWAFRFVVDGVQFAWHQPAPLTFEAHEKGNGAQHDVLAEVQPVSLQPRKFAEAKALIRWCLEKEDK